MVGAFFSWHGIFYFRLVLPLIIGILLSYHNFIPYNLGWFCIIPSVLLFITLRFAGVSTHYRADPYLGLSYILALIGLGSLLYANTLPVHISSHYSHHKGEYLIGEISEPAELKSKNTVYTVKISAVKTNQKEIKKAKGHILLQIPNDSIHATPEMTIGTLIAWPMKSVKEIQGPALPGDFNYKQYQQNKGIYHQSYCKASQIKILNIPKNRSIYAISQDIKSWISKKLTCLLSENTAAFAMALLVGDRSQLDKEVYNQFANTGTLHVLAVSGLHTGILFLLLKFLLQPLIRTKRGKLWQSMGIIIGLYAYAFITGLSPSVLRAATMFSIVQFASALDRRANVYNSIFASAFVLLLISPNILFHVGFQLSYIAVLGIVSLQKPISSIYAPSNKIVKYFWDIITVSIAAQLATFPISLYYFHQFPTYFLLANMLVIPCIFLLLIALIVLILLSAIPVISKWIAIITDFVIESIIKTTDIISQMPYVNIQDVFPSTLTVWMLYVLLTVITIGFYFSFKNRRMIITGITCILLAIGIVEEANNYLHLSIRKLTYKNIEILVIRDGKENLIVLNNIREEEKTGWLEKLKGMNKKEKIKKSQLLVYEEKGNLKRIEYSNGRVTKKAP